MTKDEILKKHEDDNEYHFHQVDREWIMEAMQEYADQQLRLGVVVRQSEQLFCECAQAKGCDIDEDGHLYCIECQKNIAAK